MSSKDMIIASKKLNKCLSRINCSLFNLDILRCRAIYGDVDTACSSVHSHSYYELHLCLTQQGRFQINEDDITLNCGEFFLLTPKTNHIVYPYPVDYSELVIAFEFAGESEVREYLNSTESFHFQGIATPFMMSAASDMLRHAAEERYGYAEFVSSIATCFFIDLFATVAKKLEKNTISADEKYIDDRIKLIKKYIEDNIDKKILTEDIASHVNVSVRHLNRIVKNSENMSVTEMIRAIRIKRAKKLLMTTQLSLSEIAEATGFCDSYHLGKVFKKVENVTPGFHRKDVHK